jgi:hypothetical protein
MIQKIKRSTEMRIIKATYHSIERAKERYSASEKTAAKNIHLALERGKRADEFKSYEREYLERVGKDGAFALAYNNFCYIVNENGFCITMYPLPVWFGRKRHYDGKQYIRNIKAYARSHSYEGDFGCAYA